jgi:hypothetical protein
VDANIIFHMCGNTVNFMDGNCIDRAVILLYANKKYINLCCFFPSFINCEMKEYTSLIDIYIHK